MTKKGAYNRFCKLVRLLGKTRSVLLDASYLVYKDQGQAERVCLERGWEVKYLKQLRRATYQAYRAARPTKGEGE